jgi:fatty-acyl-CoA synthase
MTSQGHYSIGLDKNAANYVPVTIEFPRSQRQRLSNHTSAVCEGRTFTRSRPTNAASASRAFLAARGIGRGDTVAAMLPNIPAMNERISPCRWPAAC